MRRTIKECVLHERKKSLNQKNTAILGVFDHLYALNAALWESFDEEYNRLIV